MNRENRNPASQITETDYLELLNNPGDASEEEITKAYHALANLHHPDKENVHPELDMDTELFIAASDAYAKFIAQQDERNAKRPPLYPISPEINPYPVTEVNLSPGVHVTENSYRYPRFIRI